MRAWLLVVVLTGGCSFATTRTAGPPAPLPPPLPLRTKPDVVATPTTHRPAPLSTPDSIALIERRCMAAFVILTVCFFALVACELRRRPPQAARPVTIPAGLPASAHDADLNCAYCRSVLRGAIVSCAACATPYHADCARILTACAIYACGSVTFRPGARPTFVATAALRA